ncbi:deleted in malignant brain tumors 1 protein-like isoform X2 [Patiria miniata]|uniref:SRCR domain-containing protein n=1 Tax=Patiria miniata TaxID=46514 RepID=A0A914B2G1_PATMI|nr:deleted in malignant brain tumors 1 protein-like isoform X2 [Patiria miniata]
MFINMATLQEWTRLSLALTTIFLLLNTDGANGQVEYSIRLVGGSSYLEGRVEVYVDGSWGTVCDDNWDLSDATVVCRQLGYGNALYARSAAYFGRGSGPIKYDEVNCLGDESMLHLCPLLTIDDCGHYEDAGVVCSAPSPTLSSNSSIIRLVGSADTFQGRVEVYVDGAWGTVCDDEWDINDASVVCRQLGYTGAISAPGSASFGAGSVPIALDNVRCTGRESRLQDCESASTNDCNHNKDAGVVCAMEYSIRLVGGSNYLEGRVEVYLDGSWGTVCDDLWDLSDATVVCRQLGYGNALYARLSASFGQGSGPIKFDDVNCQGDESMLHLCQFSSTNNCRHHEDAGVVCSAPSPTLSSNSSIRLVGSGDPFRGRVEVYVDGAWGTVCDDEWDINDASVVCRQLGYTGAISAPGSASFGAGSVPIALDNVRCTGRESRLQDCESASTNNCNHNKDAGVVCASTILIRLVGGTSIREGRVEVLLNGDWGTVCDDGWGLTDAKVVCRQLGFAGALSAHSLAHFGQGTVPIAMDDVQCTGSESRLTDCSFQTSHNCDHHEDAGVICIEAGFAIRLVGGSSETQGRVEVYLNGIWGTICDDGWGLDDARVVCRQLGYSNAIRAVSSARFGQGSGDIFFNDVACTGSETSLLDCVKSTVNNCGHGEDAGVICGTSGSDTSTIRLADGYSALDGRVEVYIGGLWGTVCDDDWDLADATVVCRQLGYGDALTAPGEAFYGPGTGSIVFDEVNCRGTELTIQDCAYSTIDNCQHGEDASVSCSSSFAAYEFGKVRLVEGNSKYDGYVEIYYKQQWGTICNDQWDKTDADVVCKELGHEFAISTSDASEYDTGRSSTKPIWLDDVFCGGSETRLVYCNHGQWDSNYCSHGEDVWVKCNGAPGLVSGTTIGLVCGLVGSCILLCVCCILCCCKSKKGPANSTTAVPTGGSDPGAPPVVHYHPPQQYIHQPSQPMQPSAHQLSDAEAPPPTYELVISQPTKFPLVTGAVFEIPQQPSDPAYPPAPLPPGQNPPSAPNPAVPQPQVISNPMYLDADDVIT